jgi:hypothetical protein
MQSINEVVCLYLRAVQHFPLDFNPNAEIGSKGVALRQRVLNFPLHFVLPSEVNFPIAIAPL